MLAIVEIVIFVLQVENLKKQLREAEEGHRNIKSHLPQRDDYLDKTNRQTGSLLFIVYLVQLFFFYITCPKISTP